MYMYIDNQPSVLQLSNSAGKTETTEQLQLTLTGMCQRKCFSSQGSIHYINVPTSCSHMKWTCDRE